MWSAHIRAEVRTWLATDQRCVHAQTKRIWPQALSITSESAPIMRTLPVGDLIGCTAIIRVRTPAEASYIHQTVSYETNMPGEVSSSVHLVFCKLGHVTPVVLCCRGHGYKFFKAASVFNSASSMQHDIVLQ